MKNVNQKKLKSINLASSRENVNEEELETHSGFGAYMRVSK
jgi:hypothetical protein